MMYESSLTRYMCPCITIGSDIIYLNLAGNDVIILDSHEAVTELLEKRSSIYSDRPRMPMLGELMGFDFNFGFLPYGAGIFEDIAII